MNEDEPDDISEPLPNKGGRPFHARDAKTAAVVEALVATGTRQITIAAYVGLDPKTLRRHYAGELETGKEMMIARVGLKMMKKALSGDNSCMIFVLKTQGGGGWTETTKHEHSGLIEHDVSLPRERISRRLAGLAPAE